MTINNNNLDVNYYKHKTRMRYLENKWKTLKKKCFKWENSFKILSRLKERGINLWKMYKDLKEIKKNMGRIETVEGLLRIQISIRMINQSKIIVSYGHRLSKAMGADKIRNNKVLKTKIVQKVKDKNISKNKDRINPNRV